MGWWNQSDAGDSLVAEDTGLVWGDPPADVVDACIEGIRADFRRTWQRDPSVDELRAGFEFSLRGYEQTPSDQAAAPVAVTGLLNVVPEDDEKMTPTEEAIARLAGDLGEGDVPLLNWVVKAEMEDGAEVAMHLDGRTELWRVFADGRDAECLTVEKDQVTTDAAQAEREDILATHQALLAERDELRIRIPRWADVFEEALPDDNDDDAPPRLVAAYVAIREMRAT